jgi:hypothetical protein
MAMALLATLLLGGIAGAVLLTKRSSAQRSAALSELAVRLGWGFHAEVPFKAVPDLDRFELFRAGHSKKLRNLLTSPAAPAAGRVVVFDYEYQTGGGKSQQTHRQTVCYVTHDDLRLPAFSLRPEHFFHRIASAFGFRDINFERRPEFSRLFLLRGGDEAAIRAAFHDDVLEFFEQRAGCCAAGDGRELLYWRAGRFAAAEQVEALVADGNELTLRLLGAPRQM